MMYRFNGSTKLMDIIDTDTNEVVASVPVSELAQRLTQLRGQKARASAASLKRSRGHGYRGRKIRAS